jgi:hypothetical protein
MSRKIREIQEEQGVKIINGSGKLLNQYFVKITSEKISFGEDPAEGFLFRKIYKILLLLIFFAMILYLFLYFSRDAQSVSFSSGLLRLWPRGWYIYVFISATLTLFGILKIYYSSPPEDKRMIYQSSDIEAFQIDYNNGNNVVANKSMGGSLAGAAVGGALFGGFGAVVGASASGNNITKIDCDTATATIRFVDGEWVVMILTENLEIKNILKLADSKNICPI